MRHLVFLGLVATACSVETLHTRDIGITPATPNYARIAITTREAHVYRAKSVDGYPSCPTLEDRGPSEHVPAGTAVMISNAVPHWRFDGLTQGCESLVALDGSTSVMISLSDLARVGTPAFASASPATTAWVYGRGEDELVFDLPSGRERKLPEGTKLEIIGRESQRHGAGIVARLEDGALVWGRVMVTENASWRAEKAFSATCAALYRAAPHYPPLPGTATLMASLDRNKARVFHWDVRAHDLEGAPPAANGEHRFVFSDVSGPLLVNAQKDIVGPSPATGHRELLVRPTGRIVDVGLVKALELDVVYSYSPCFFDETFAQSAVTR